MRRDLAHLLDTAVPVVVAAIVVAGVTVRGEPSSRPLALALGLLAAATLIARRRWPAPTLVVSGGLVLVLFAVDHAAGAIVVVAPATALYSLALMRGRFQLVIAAAATAAAVVAADTFLAGRHPHTVTLQTVAHVALVAVPLLAAEALRNRRSYITLLLERLELAERTREEEAQRRVAEDRLRIARDLHDVVAHTLTTINVQAGVAAHLLDSRSANARAALTTIADASHEALDELRAMVGVLREDDVAPRQPSPSLESLAELIANARTAGLDVRFDVDGKQPDRVPEAVQLAAFRIVQESLTNARRHAGDSPARVILTFRSDRLLVTVENAGGTAGSIGNGGGVGIVGMRERAAALGGTLDADRSTHGFRVAAELPFRRSA